MRSRGAAGRPRPAAAWRYPSWPAALLCRRTVVPCRRRDTAPPPASGPTAPLPSPPPSQALRDAMADASLGRGALLSFLLPSSEPLPCQPDDLSLSPLAVYILMVTATWQSMVSVFSTLSLGPFVAGGPKLPTELSTQNKCESCCYLPVSNLGRIHLKFETKSIHIKIQSPFLLNSGAWTVFLLLTI